MGVRGVTFDFLPASPYGVVRTSLEAPDRAIQVQPDSGHKVKDARASYKEAQRIRRLEAALTAKPINS